MLILMKPATECGTPNSVMQNSVERFSSVCITAFVLKQQENSTVILLAVTNLEPFLVNRRVVYSAFLEFGVFGFCFDFEAGS